MTHPSTDFPDALDPVSVIQAIERNLADWYRALTAYVPGAAVCEEADHIRVVCPASHPVCNAVLWAHFGRGHSDERIRRIVANFQDRGVPGLWWIGPSSRPVDLNRHLIAAGLESMDTLHGMAADLRYLRAVEAPDESFDVTEALAPDALTDWVRPFDRSFHVGEATLRVLAPIRDVVSSGEGALRLFLGRHGGLPVSCAVLYQGPGVAGLYYVGTEPSARNRGYASVIVSHAAQAAREAGYRVCILHATPLSADMYRRLGFVEYCRLRTLAWRPRKADASLRSA